MQILKSVIQMLLIYSASIGVYCLWEHYKKTGKDKLIESKHFLICALIVMILFYIAIWR